MSVYLTVTGRDHHGVTSGLFGLLDALGASVLDVEQVVVGNQLLLGILVEVPGADAFALREPVRRRGADLGVAVDVRDMPGAPDGPAADRLHVTLLGHPLTAAAIAAVAATLAACGANIDRIDRLSAAPVASYELLVSGGDRVRVRTELPLVAADVGVDVAVQAAGLHRRAQRLVVLDVDSTLVQGEVVERLADRAGVGGEVARITAAAMAGELDFEASLRRRVGLLAGLDAAALDEVRRDLRLTPGARTLVRTLRRLGFVVGIVSGGFTQVTDALAADLGLDFAAANTLEVADGRLTGRLVGPVLDRAGKAEALESFAARAGVPLAQTVAVGDGANDLDMLARAGLGVAFNAAPVVRRAADTSVTVPYLDVILSLLGIPRAEVDALEAEQASDSCPGRTVSRMFRT